MNVSKTISQCKSPAAYAGLCPFEALRHGRLTLFFAAA